MRAERKKLSRGAAKHLIKKLFDHYDVERSPDHAPEVLVWAVLDGLVKAPPPRRKRVGRPATWRGKLGIELLKAVERVLACPFVTVVEVADADDTDSD